MMGIVIFILYLSSSCVVVVKSGSCFLSMFDISKVGVSILSFVFSIDIHSSGILSKKYFLPSFITIFLILVLFVIGRIISSSTMNCASSSLMFLGRKGLFLVFVFGTFIHFLLIGNMISYFLLASLMNSLAVFCSVIGKI